MNNNNNNNNNSNSRSAASTPGGKNCFSMALPSPSPQSQTLGPGSFHSPLISFPTANNNGGGGAKQQQMNPFTSSTTLAASPSANSGGNPFHSALASNSNSNKAEPLVPGHQSSNSKEKGSFKSLTISEPGGGLVSSTSSSYETTPNHSALLLVGASTSSLQHHQQQRPREFQQRPVITIQSLGRFVYDSWLNGPFKKTYFPSLYENKIPLDAKKMSRAALKLLFSNACWLSYVFHHTIVQAACQGYDVHIDQDTRVTKCWVFDGEKVNPSEVPHSWNVFQTEKVMLSEEEAKLQHSNDLARRLTPSSRTDLMEEKAYRESKYFCCDLTIDQFEDEQKLEASKTVPAYIPVKGSCRLNPGVFCSARESRHWIGKEVLLDSVLHQKDLHARQDLWQYFVSLLLGHSVRAFQNGGTTTTSGSANSTLTNKTGTSRSSSNTSSRNATPNSASCSASSTTFAGAAAPPPLQTQSQGSNHNNQQSSPQLFASAAPQRQPLQNNTTSTSSSPNGTPKSFNSSPLATSQLLPPLTHETSEETSMKYEADFKYYMQQLQMNQMHATMMNQMPVMLTPEQQQEARERQQQQQQQQTTSSVVAPTTSTPIPPLAAVIAGATTTTTTPMMQMQAPNNTVMQQQQPTTANQMPMQMPQQQQQPQTMMLNPAAQQLQVAPAQVAPQMMMLPQQQTQFSQQPQIVMLTPEQIQMMQSGQLVMMMASPTSPPGQFHPQVMQQTQHLQSPLYQMQIQQQPPAMQMMMMPQQAMVTPQLQQQQLQQFQQQQQQSIANVVNGNQIVSPSFITSSSQLSSIFTTSAVVGNNNNSMTSNNSSTPNSALGSSSSASNTTCANRQQPSSSSPASYSVFPSTAPQSFSGSSSSTSNLKPSSETTRYENTETAAFSHPIKMPHPPPELSALPRYQKDIMQINKEVSHFINTCIMCGGDEALRRKQVLFSFMQTRIMKTKELLQVSTPKSTPNPTLEASTAV